MKNGISSLRLPGFAAASLRLASEVRPAVTLRRPKANLGSIGKWLSAQKQRNRSALTRLWHDLLLTDGGSDESGAIQRRRSRAARDRRSRCLVRVSLRDARSPRVVLRERRTLGLVETARTPALDQGQASRSR